MKGLILFILIIVFTGCASVKGKSVNYTDTEKNIDITASVSENEELDITVNNTTLSIGKDGVQAE